MKFWQNWTYVVYNRHTEFQADIFIPAGLITKRIKKVLFSKFTKPSFRSLNPSLCLCSQLLTIHFNVSGCGYFSWLGPGVSSISFQRLLHPVPHRIEETDDPSLWNSVTLLLENLSQRYSIEKDHPSHQLYQKPGTTTAGEKWRIHQAYMYPHPQT